MDWYLRVIRDHYADVSGRARRTEFWTFALVHIGILIALSVVAAVLGFVWRPLGWIGTLVYSAYGLATIAPGVAVTVRRLHDTGKTGWLALVGLIPVVGLVLLYFMAVEGDPGPNEHGPDPKEASKAKSTAGAGALSL